MSIQEVTMYRAVCNVCGKDDGSEFYAWSDAEQALETWRDDECGISLDDGRLYCYECIPSDVCQFSQGDGKHTPTVQGLTCAECDVSLAVRS